MPVAPVVDLLSCPYCTQRLAMVEDDRGVRCDLGHRFDLARQGYLNLSAGPQPANADTAAMVAARERFLSAGFFDPVSQAAIDRVPLGAGARVLDAGAGTGRLLAALLDRGSERRGIALDVSTAAARRAARAHPRMGAVVADVWRRLPLADGSTDLVVSNFAPRNPSEFARVLTAGGQLLTITPAPDHLAELRGAYGLLGIQSDKVDRLAQTLAGRFEPVSADRVAHRARWPAEVVADAIAMGPNAFHGEVERPAPAPADVTVAVDVRLWRRLEDPVR